MGELADLATKPEWDATDWDRWRSTVTRMSDRIDAWEGIPVPIGDDAPMILRPGHPVAALYPPPERDTEDGERVVNHWMDRRRNRDVFIIDTDGRRTALVLNVSPDRSMERLTYWMTTIGGADAWDIKAEHKARECLRGMITDRQWRHYDLTGIFIESSPRSGLTYVFRRLRPTIVLSPHGKSGLVEPDTAMRCIAVLCLHPIGFYSRSWAGCMVPTDDVIAHLSWMRGDESGYWGKSIQHKPSDPEAGL